MVIIVSSITKKETNNCNKIMQIWEITTSQKGKDREFPVK